MRIYLLGFFILISQLSHSQTKETKHDTTKKVIYSDVVKLDSMNKYELYKRAVKWISKQGFTEVEEDPYGCKIIAKNKFTVYTDVSVLAKPNGNFTHNVMIEARDGRYKYVFSEFKYHYIKQNRDLKYVEVKGEKPIEDTKAPGWKKQWAKNKKQVNNKMEVYIKSLYNEMSYTAPVPVAKPDPKKEDW
jgi:hypothetical protein